MFGEMISWKGELQWPFCSKSRTRGTIRAQLSLREGFTWANQRFLEPPKSRCCRMILELMQGLLKWPQNRQENKRKGIISFSTSFTVCIEYAITALHERTLQLQVYANTIKTEDEVLLQCGSAENKDKKWTKCKGRECCSYRASSNNP